MNFAPFKPLTAKEYKFPIQPDPSKYKLESSGAFDGPTLVIDKSTGEEVYSLKWGDPIDDDFIKEFERKFFILNF